MTDPEAEAVELVRALSAMAGDVTAVDAAILADLTGRSSRDAAVLLAVAVRVVFTRCLSEPVPVPDERTDP